MKKAISIIMLLICVLALPACTATNTADALSGDVAVQNDQSMTIYVPEKDNVIFSGPLHAKDLLYGSGNSNGFYSVEVMGPYANIMYTDYQTRKQLVLCNRPECTHDNESCSAYEGVGSNTPSILALDNKLVFVYPGNPYYYEELGNAVLPRIDISELDGSNKKTIVTFSSEVKTDLSNIGFDDENLYLMQQLVEIKGESIYSSLQFQQINLSTGNIQRIADFSDMDKQNIHFLGASENMFIFKRIKYGERSESAEEGRAGWDAFLAGQVHEIFTVNKDKELSNALITYPQGEYSSYVLGGKIYLMSPDTSLISIDPETGVEETVVSKLPFEHELLYGLPKALLNDWLIIDLVAPEQTDTRYAVNIKTQEYRALTLATQFDGLTEPYIIYTQVGDEILVRTGRSWSDFEVTLPDGSVVNNPRIIDVWSIMKIDDFLNNNDIYESIEK